MTETRRSFLGNAPKRIVALAVGGSLLASCVEPKPLPEAKTPAEKSVNATYNIFDRISKVVGVSADSAQILTFGALFEENQNPYPVVDAFRSVRSRLNSNEEVAASLAVASRLNDKIDVVSIYKQINAIGGFETVEATILTNLIASSKGDPQLVLNQYRDIKQKRPGLPNGAALSLLSSSLINKSTDEALRIFNRLDQSKAITSEGAGTLTVGASINEDKIPEIVNLYNDFEGQLHDQKVSPILTLASVINGYDSQDIKQMFNFLRNRYSVQTETAASLTLASAAKTSKLPVYETDLVTRNAAAVASSYLIYYAYFILFSPTYP